MSSASTCSFYVSFGIGAWVAALLTAIGAWGDESFALTLPWLVVVPSCFVAAFATQPGRVERLAATTGSLPRRALGYAIAGTAWVRAALADPPARRMVVSSVLYWVGNVACLWA